MRPRSARPWCPDRVRFGRSGYICGPQLGCAACPGGCQSPPCLLWGGDGQGQPLLTSTTARWADLPSTCSRSGAEPLLPAGLRPDRGLLCRSCLTCGATKTPQWREGPLGELAASCLHTLLAARRLTDETVAGPKTLCNACGVKRCRQMRMLVEGKRTSAPKQAAIQRKVRAICSCGSGSPPRGL